MLSFEARRLPHGRRKRVCRAGTTTDHDGNYVLLELPVGHYSLQVSAKGFQEHVQDGITLNVNETASVSAHLAVGSEKQQVLVSGDAELIEPTVTSMGKVVQQRELEDLPLNGRNFSQLGLLQPGVVPLTPGIAEAGGGLRDGQAYAVNGQRPESNNFLIDGANNFNGVDGGFVLKPPVDAISEFRIITHSANAEFGGSLGSTTNIITRSGTNQLHGTLWEFLRNDAVDANNYFAPTKEPLKQNQFGATIGAPIKKDKTFIFGFYEGFRNHQGVSGQTTVPSLKQRTGDFSELCPEGFTHGFCNNPANQLFNVFANAPYPNNQVPQDQIDSVSENLLSFFPLPNAGTNLFSTTQILSNNTDQFGIKVDHYLDPRDTLSFRYMFYQLSQVDPLSPGGASVPGFPVGEDQRAQNFVAEETHTFSPTLIAVARFSFLRNKFLFGEHENHQPPSSLGFQYEPSLDIATGPPFIQVNGYANCWGSHHRPAQHLRKRLRLLRIAELGARQARAEIRRRIPISANQRAARDRDQRLLRIRAIPGNGRVRQLPHRAAGRLPARYRRFLARYSRQQCERDTCRTRIRSRRDSRSMPDCATSCPSRTPKSIIGSRCLSRESNPRSCRMRRRDCCIRAIPAFPRA